MKNIRLENIGSSKNRRRNSEKVQHSPGGIKGRWMLNSLSFVVAILASVVIFVSTATAGYYYANVQENLYNKVFTTANFFNKYMNKTYDQFYNSAERFVNEFEQKDKIEVQIIDAYGRVLLSSSGLTAGIIPATNDVEKTLNNHRTEVFVGKDSLSGERVMSVSSPLTYQRGSTIGAVRYVSSLALVEKQITSTVLSTILLAIIFFIMVVISNRYFIKSIVEPVVKINIIAKEIAQGRYGMRLHKIYDDEIGQLCDTINYMSDEICRAERMKNDFISSVSHELRTPLTAIAGWGETLIFGGAEDKDEVMQGLSIIQKESKRLTSMVEELLEFARLESGRMKLDMETFDISIELYEAIYMYSNLLTNEGIKIQYRKTDEDFFVNGDRHRLKQVFLNIIDNAAKYGKGGEKIDIDLRLKDGFTVVNVTDYGAGIPERELPFVKEKFYKGSSKQRGSGIGLAVTDEIIKLHGGSLDISSNFGEGTSVTVTMPTLKMHNNITDVRRNNRTDDESDVNKTDL